MKKTTRFLLAMILVVVAAFGVMACVDNTPDDNTDETTYKIEITCKSEEGEYKLDPAKDAYAKGDKVTLTVTPKSDYELDKVTIDGKEATANSNGSYTITVGEADVKVNITFKTKGDVPPAPSTYTVEVNCDSAKATVAFEKEGPYEKGEEVKFTVTPVGENKIKSVKFNDEVLTADDEGKYTIKIAEENVLDVEFESEEPPAKTIYTVSLEYEQDQGSVTLSPSAQENKYEEGTEVTINITPNGNYEIDTVKANNDVIVADAGAYKFTVNGDTTVTVTFKEKSEEPPAKTTYTVSLEYEQDQGSVTLSPSAQENKYEEGTEVTINITPNDNYEIDTVKANNDEIVANAGAYKFTVNGDTTVTVTFKEKSVEPPVTDDKFAEKWIGNWRGTNYKVNITAQELTFYILSRRGDGISEQLFDTTDMEVSEERIHFKYVDAFDLPYDVYLIIDEDGNMKLFEDKEPDDEPTDTLTKQGAVTPEEPDEPEEPDVPSSSTNPADYVGEWVGEISMGLPSLISATFTVTQTNLGLHGVISASLGDETQEETFDFVLNDENRWYDEENEAYLTLNEDKTEIRISSSTGAEEETVFTFTKGEPELPPSSSTNPADYVGDWEGTDNAQGYVCKITEVAGSLKVELSAPDYGEE